MSAYAKLMSARIELQNQTLKKSGHNKFAGYNYFELGDFLPVVQTIFHKNKMAGVVSFGAELATLTIVDLEDNFRWRNGNGVAKEDQEWTPRAL